MSEITIALSKGRLAEHAVELFEKCGIKCKNILQPTRKLVLFDDDKRYRFIFVKPSDVPTYVEHGVADIGVCGSDTLNEEDKNIYEMLDLKFGACRLCLAGKENGLNKPVSKTLIVATKYINTAKKLFQEREINVELIKLNGSVELGPIVGLSDIILDIVESGKTLKENNLHILEEICPVSARLVVNKVSLKTKAEQIKPFVKLVAENIQ